MKKFLSKIHYSTLLFFGALLLVGAVGCQAVATQQTTTQSAEVDSTPALEPTVSVEVAESTTGEGEGQVVESEDPNQCLVCHTDKQALMDTADPVVVVESESSGEG